MSKQLQNLGSDPRSLFASHTLGKGNEMNTQNRTRGRVSVAFMAVVTTALCAFSGQARAAVVLSTDFDNSGTSGSSMNGVVWTENGLSAPTTLTASDTVRTSLSGAADAEGGYFSVNVNVNNSTEGAPAWSTTWTITADANVVLTDIVLASAEANSSGSLGAGNGSSNINLTIVDNNSTLTIADETLIRNDGSGASQNLSYTTPLSLTPGNTYDVTFTVWEQSSSGHFEAFDSVTFNGTVIVPEPGTAMLAALAVSGLATIRRRRRR